MTLLAALAFLGLTRLLPEHGVWLWLRLAAATLVLLLPGRYVARAIGARGGLAATLVLSVGVVAAALALTFAVHGSLTLTLVLVLAVGLVAAPFRRRVELDHAPAAIALAGLGLGIALWSIEGVLSGDALFHLGRVRKLDDFGSLTLRAVDEFKDGGLHPGYAFPLWHGWLALISRLAGVDPAQAVLHESSLLVPVALVLAFEMGRVLFRSSSAGVATMLAQVGMIALAPGDGGAYPTLELPGTAARQLLVPAVIILFFSFVRAPSRGVGVALAFAGVDLAFVHPTYALFIAIPLVGFLVVRVLGRGSDLRYGVAGLCVFGIPVLLVFAWLSPIVGETRSHNPGAGEKARAFETYASDLVVASPSRYHLAPSLVDRTGAIAIAALALVPLAAFAARRRWSAFVLGGTVLVLGIELSSLLFPHFSDLVSLSQSRRAAGFVPFAFAFAGGIAVLVRALRVLVLPLALGAGIALQLAWPGDFGRRLAHGGPGAVTWFALWVGLAATVVAIVVARRGVPPFERYGLLAGAAAALFVLPVAVHGFAHWDAESPRDGNALTPGVVSYLRGLVPERAIVFADLETSYRLSAYLPVYVANAPPTHVADTKANDPKGRRLAWLRFLASGNPAIPRSYGAHWVVLRGRERIGGRARLVYRDAVFRVYRL
jgi:hypothetical protein